MRWRAGIQAEVLASLALVMLLATLILTVVWAARHEASLRDVVGRALLLEARHAPDLRGTLFPGTDWWIRGPGGRLRRLAGAAGPLDPVTQALAEQVASENVPLLRPGPIWAGMRFATPVGRRGEVAIARLPRQVSIRLRVLPLAAGGAVLVADALIFTAFGAARLRRRVVLPLQRLAAAARALGQGATGVRAPVEGAAEVALVGRSFNDMTDTLEGRSEALGKAVVELRQANEGLRRARDGLDRAERLAAVGRLAAGVAHEVGNPIGAILALLDLAARDPGPSEQTRAHLARAAREGERVRVILRQLLDFSRPARGEPRLLDLERAASESIALVRAQRRYASIGFEVAAQPGTPRAFADPAAVSQILLNLLLNAADAVGEHGERRVRVELRPSALRRRLGDGAEPPQRQRHDAVDCVVADAGHGIPEEDRERIFDPFFTTKPPGAGTGLGLASAQRLALEAGGSLEIGPPPAGYRTALVLRLPVPPGDAGSCASQGAAESAGDCAAGARGQGPRSG